MGVKDSVLLITSPCYVRGGKNRERVVLLIDAPPFLTKPGPPRRGSVPAGCTSER